MTFLVTKSIFLLHMCIFFCNFAPKLKGERNAKLFCTGI